MAVAAVGFDLDETLAIPDRDRSILLAEAADAVGAPPIDRDAYLDAHRRNLTRESRQPIFTDLLSDHDDATAAAELTDAYRRRVNEALVPLEGIESFLASLREDYAIGLLTNGPARAQWEKIAILGWEAVFDAVVVSGDLDAAKPDPEAFRSLLRELNRDPHDTVYVGDDPTTDVAGAVAAGLQPVQVVYPAGPAPDPRAVAHVDRADLIGTLPTILAAL